MLEIEMKYFGLAVERDGNAKAAEITIKANERRSAHIGANPRDRACDPGDARTRAGEATKRDGNARSL